MQATEVTPKPSFKGKKADQEIALDVFNVMRAAARFYPKTAPIRASLSSLGAYLASTRGEHSAEEWQADVGRIVRANAAVFGVEEIDDVLYATTTMQGTPPAPPVADGEHLLAERFTEPKQAPERPAQPIKRAKVAHLPEVSEPELIGGPSVSEVEASEADDFEVVEPEAEVAIEEPVQRAAPVGPETLVTDVEEVDDAALAATIGNQLRDEITVANFGDLWMTEEKVPRLSRGDLRRLREYLLERNEPLSDEALLQDVLNVRPNAEEYELMRFAINFRLSREQREFEYVGTAMKRYWSTSGLPSIGTAKRKPSEIGTDFRFLLEEQPSEFPAGETVVEHVLTFYEYQYGVLPLSGLFASLFPKPELPDQRAAVLVFESPQNYETFFAELHFPSGNRGGYIAGLDRFFLENLVPGALFTVERNDQDGHFLIEFLPVSGEDRKLLQIDEKRGRYVFRPMTFYCATQEDMVVSENRFPQLANLPLLEERIRRRPELTLTAVFERIGEQVGTTDSPKFMAMMDDLVPACNVERPMSPDLVRDIVTKNESSSFSTDPDVEDVFYYEPAKS
ncbi:MAG: hypothetical protein WBW04_12455 [Nitrolancea sp.]